MRTNPVNDVTKVNFSRIGQSTLKNETAQNVSFPKSDDKGQNFQEDTKLSKLDDRVPTRVSLAKIGFNVPFKVVAEPGKSIRTTKEIPYMVDMNSGKTYQNKNGDTIRISEFDGELATGLDGAISAEYKSRDGKVRDQVLYDPDGNPLKGTLIIVREDGTHVTYQYDYDMDGNRQMKNCNIEYPRSIK